MVLFWVAQGVSIFRVDNPHTKPFCFWEWLIHAVKTACPEVIFLAEAFTRPKVMYRLAKLGFTQSYTYFAWRKTRRRTDAIFHHTYPDAGAGIFAPQSVAQYTRYPHGIPTIRRAPGFYKSAGPGGNAGGKLWHLWPGL